MVRVTRFEPERGRTVRTRDSIARVNQSENVAAVAGASSAAASHKLIAARYARPSLRRGIERIFFCGVEGRSWCKPPDPEMRVEELRLEEFGLGSALGVAAQLSAQGFKGPIIAPFKTAQLALP